ncbi:PQQ-binding-like beta-propeller repeat protein, partial [Chloroflexota bacterium]
MKGEIVSVNVTDGRLLWAVPLESPEPSSGGFGCAPASTAVAIYGSPAVAEDEGLVYIGGYNGKIYAFTPGRDEPRWVYPRERSLDGTVVGGLVVAQGRVYFGSSDGKVYALDANDGFKEWEFENGDKIWSTPVIDGDTLFIGSFDNKLYALNTADGSKKWEYETEGAIVATPVVHNNTVYIGSFDRYLYAIDATDGSLKWKFLAGNWFW